MCGGEGGREGVGKGVWGSVMKQEGPRASTFTTSNKATRLPSEAKIRIIVIWSVCGMYL